MYSNSFHPYRSRLTRADRRALLVQLREFPVFAHCDAGDLAALLKVSQLCTLPADRAMTAEGSPADFCYVILEGSAGVHRGGARIVAIGPGVLVGEMSALNGDLCSATVITLTAVRALAIDSFILQAMLRKRPGLDRTVRTQMHERTGVTVHRFERRRPVPA